MPTALSATGAGADKSNLNQATVASNIQKPTQNGNAKTPTIIGASGAVMPQVYFVPSRGTHPAAGVHFFQAPNGGAVPVAPVAPFFPPTAAQDSLRRANPYAEDSPSPKKRRVRHCAKCGSETCKGRGGGSNCPNPCRDCGKMDCKGRSSTKPGRLCDNRASAPISANQE